jgi:acyl-CoA synthetase (AMP-forming)/AMP-acid ligase II
LQIQEYLELGARRVPGKTALVCGERCVTYESLEAQANALARRLMALGVKRGDRVGIWLENSIEAIVVLKKGAEVTQGEIQRRCAERLEDFMVPKYVEFQEALPKTDVGKIKKQELRKERKT